MAPLLVSPRSNTSSVGCKGCKSQQVWRFWGHSVGESRMMSMSGCAVLMALLLMSPRSNNASCVSRIRQEGRQGCGATDTEILGKVKQVPQVRGADGPASHVTALEHFICITQWGPGGASRVRRQRRGIKSIKDAELVVRRLAGTILMSPGTNTSSVSIVRQEGEKGCGATGAGVFKWVAQGGGAGATPPSEAVERFAAAAAPPP